MKETTRVAAFILGVALLAGCGSTHHEQVVLQGIDARSKHDLAFAAVIIRRRLDLLGVRKVAIKEEPGGRLVITTGRRLPLGERLLLVKTGSLAFYDLEADLSGRSKTAAGQPIAATSLTHLLRRASFGMGHARQLFLVHNGQLVAGPETTRKALVAIAKLHGDSPKKPEVLAAPANTTLVTCEAGPTNGCPGTAALQGTFYYLFKYYPDRSSNPIPEATGRDLKLSAVKADLGMQPGQGPAIVQLAFTSTGNRKFQQITRAEAARGQATADAAGRGHSNDPIVVQQFAQHFAIVLDGDLKSTPYINYKDNPDGIDPSGSGAEISNMRTYPEAKALAIVLASGALPFHFALIR